MSKLFSKKIKKLRLDAGLTLEEVGRYLGSSKAYAWQLENKSQSNPSAEVVIRLARLFSVEPDFLILDDYKAQTDEHLEASFLHAYKSLSKRNKSTIRKIVLGLQSA